LLKYIILKKLRKKTGFVAAGILIILALILGIIFLIKLFPHQKSNSPSKLPFSGETSQNDKEFQAIQIFSNSTSKTLDLTKYKTSDGKFEKVDTTIQTTNDPQFKYQNTTNNFQTYFTNKPKKSDNNIKIQRDNASISFQVLTKLTVNKQDQSLNLNLDNSQLFNSTDNQKNRLTYPKIYQKDNATIDAVYTIYNDKLSEEMIINQYFGALEISQNLFLENVYAKQEDTLINFYSNTTHQRLWFIPQPKMYEQKNQQETSDGIYYKVECQDSSKAVENCSQLTLTKVVNEAGQKWLSDPKRQYPVIIDPDFQIDNADTAANWVSTDPANFTVSQETTLKQEGTGSVKIVGVGATTCWGLSGACDSGCNGSTLWSGTTYQSCYVDYDCGDGTYTYIASDPVGTEYITWSSCSSVGTGNCYKKTGSPNTRYTGGAYCTWGACDSGTFYPSYSTCSWTTISNFNDSATITKGATNLSTSKSITFWVRSVGRTGSFMQFAMGEVGTTEQTTNFSIGTTNTWEQKTWDISAIAAASRDAITKFTFKNIGTSASFTLYFDDIKAISTNPNPPLSCVINESPTDTYLIPKWTDSSSDENGFQLEKNTDAGGFSFLTNLAAGITGYQDNSVSSNHTYSYRVRSYTTGTGTTIYSEYCNHPTLNLGTGSFLIN
jgi:hypothetical protein